MRFLKMLIVVGTIGAVAAGPAMAQTTPPAQPPAKPPATAPAPPPTPAAAAEAPRPYPEGAKVAYIDIQMVAQSSVDGKAATAKLQELEKKKVAEIQAKNKQLEDARTKQQTSSGIMNDAARLSLETPHVVRYSEQRRDVGRYRPGSDAGSDQAPRRGVQDGAEEIGRFQDFQGSEFHVPGSPPLTRNPEPRNPQPATLPACVAFHP
jgi:hypothetical protein